MTPTALITVCVIPIELRRSNRCIDASTPLYTFDTSAIATPKAHSSTVIWAARSRS